MSLLVGSPNISQFFHKPMLKHKNRNFIFSLTIRNGHQLSYHRDIENEITSFYNNLLKKTNPNRLQSIEKDNGLYYKIGH